MVKLQLFLFLILTLLSGGCSGPPWFEVQDQKCPSEKLCVTGQGSGIDDAKKDAIQSFKNVLVSKISPDNQLPWQSVGGHSDKDVNLIASTILKKPFENLFVNREYVDKKRSLVQIFLDKKMVVNALEDAITAIDKKMQYVFKRGIGTSIIEMKELYFEREMWNDSYEFFHGKRVPSPIKAGVIFQRDIENARSFSSGCSSCSSCKL